MKFLALSAVSILGIAVLACNKAKSDTPAPASAAAQSQAPADPRSTEIGLSQQQIDAAMDQALKIDAQRCWGLVKQFVATGSRPLGGPGHKKAEDFIHSHLKGDQVEDDAFTQSTPQGSFPVRNVIAKYPGKKPRIVGFRSHYQTNIWLPKTYVRANDGGASTGLLLEFASVLHEKVKSGPLDGYSV